MQGYERKGNCIPSPQYQSFKGEVLELTPRQDAARITRLTNGSLDERAKVPTTPELILDT